MSSIPCPRCGVPLPAEARFCLKCGSAIEGAATGEAEGASTKAFDVPGELLDRARREAPSGSMPLRGAPPPGPTTSALHAAARPTISSYTRTPWALFALLGVVVLAGAGFGAWWFLFQSEPVVATPPIVTLGAPIAVFTAAPSDPAAVLPFGTAAPGMPLGVPIPGAPGRPGAASAGGNAPGTGPGIGAGAGPGVGPAGPGGSAGPVGPGVGPAAGPRSANGTAAAGSDDGAGEAGGGEGYISPAAVSRVMAFYVPRVRSCYERVLRNEPGVRGTVQVRFTVDGSGSVTRADVSRNTTGSQQLAACVTGQMRTWRFPAAEGGDAVFEYPFRFGGGGGGEEGNGLGLPGATED